MARVRSASAAAITLVIVALAPGTTWAADASKRDLSYVDEAGTRLIGPGTYSLSVGGGQPGTKAPTIAAEFLVTGRKELPR